MASARTMASGAASNHSGGGQLASDGGAWNPGHAASVSPTQVLFPPKLGQTRRHDSWGMGTLSRTHGFTQRALAPSGRPKNISLPANSGAISARRVPFERTMRSANSPEVSLHPGSADARKSNMAKWLFIRRRRVSLSAMGQGRRAIPHPRLALRRPHKLPVSARTWLRPAKTRCARRGGGYAP